MPKINKKSMQSLNRQVCSVLVYSATRVCLQVWRYYMSMAYLVVPPVPSPIRCASPDLSLR